MKIPFVNKIKNVWGLFEGNKLSFSLILGLIALTSIFEMFSVGMVLPILESVINDESNVGMSRVFSFLLDMFPRESWTLAIITLLMIFSILTVASKIFTTYYSQKVIQKIQLNWRLELFEKYLRSVYEFVLRFKQGEIIHNINVEVQQAAGLLNTIIQWITNLLIGVSIYILLLVSSFYVTLFLTVIIVGIMYLVKILGERFQLKLSKVIIKSNQQLSSFAAEAIMALQQVKIFSLENHFMKNYEKAGLKRNHAWVSRATIQQIPGNITFMIMPLVLLVFYLYFTFISNQAFKDFIPTLGFVFVGFTRISASLMSVTQQRMIIYNNLPSLQTVEKILNTNIGKEEIESGQVFDNLGNDIEIKDITFSYLKDQTIFENLDLTIPKGKMTAMIGPSGSGKSTLSYLLVGLYKPKSGQILINGKNISEYSMESWRRKIGYVTQDTYIFNMSIRENIKVGKPEATDEEVMQAAEAAHCTEFIDRLPQGMETIVGERGMKLSGGQRQRIAIARAMIRKPELYIFDEATSALDNHSEKLIQKSIEEISRQSTMLVIAHRLTTIENADVVYDLGEINSEKFVTYKS
ncbi:MAG: ABC transporter ATP-binding protein [Candidatus Kapaibacterium sp.]